MKPTICFVLSVFSCNLACGQDYQVPRTESLPRVGNYDLFWRDEAQFIPTIGGEYRTSAIIDPPRWPDYGLNVMIMTEVAYQLTVSTIALTPFLGPSG